MQVEVNATKVMVREAQLFLLYLLITCLWLDLLATKHLHEVEGALHIALILHELDAFLLHVLQSYDIIVINLIEYLPLYLILTQLTRCQPESLAVQL